MSELLNLPDLTINLIIFVYLSYEDVFKLRLTCKKLKELIDRKNFDRLNLFVNCYPFHNFHFKTNKLVNYPNSLKAEDFQILNSLPFRKRFNRIQKLAIYYLPRNDLDKLPDHLTIDLDQLNHFEELVYLDIKKANKLQGRLALNSLKICQLCTATECEFELDCPALEALNVMRFARPKLINDTNNLPYLSVEMVEDDNFLFELYLGLTNLRTLRLRYYRNLLLFLVLFLDDIENGHFKLPTLKRIELTSLPYPEMFDRSIAGLIEELKRYPQSKEIEFFVNSKAMDLAKFVQVTKVLATQPPGAHNEIFEANGSLVKFMCDNPILHCAFEGLEIVSIEGEVQLDEQLIERMRNIRILQINSKSIDETSFRALLKTCKKVEFLRFFSTDLEQHLFDLIPAYWPGVHELILSDWASDHSNLENFKFIAEFKNLITLCVRFYIPNEILTFLFRHCPSLIEMTFIGANRPEAAVPLGTNETKLFMKIIKNPRSYEVQLQTSSELKMWTFPDFISAAFAFNSQDLYGLNYYLGL